MTDEPLGAPYNPNDRPIWGDEPPSFDMLADSIAFCLSFMFWSCSACFYFDKARAFTPALTREGDVGTTTFTCPKCGAVNHMTTRDVHHV